MPWTRERKYFASFICRQNHSKVCQQHFAGSFTIFPGRPNLSLGTQISSHRVRKQPQLEDRKSKIWQEVDYNMS